MRTLAKLFPSGGRSRSLPSKECGQVLILFVMAATVIFVIGAIVVDIGLWVTERRNAQAAADLAALAAATQLRNPNASADAQAKGLEFAKRNGYDPAADSDIQVRVKPDVAADTVQVEIEENGGSLFAGIFGITSMNVGATAVASLADSAPGPGWVLFANSSECNTNSPPLNILANHVTVNGSTHSNGNIYIDGPQDHFVGSVTWVCPSGFSDGHPQNDTYQPNPYPVVSQPAIIPAAWGDIEPHCAWVPADTHIENFPSLWVGGNPASKQLLSNVICADGDLWLTGDDISGHVTLAAHGKITISSTGSFGNHLQPADSLSSTPAENLLVFADQAAIDVTAAAGEYRGFIYAANSSVAFNGSANVDLTGALIAETILVTGNNFTMTALPGSAGPPMPPEIQLAD
jgi:hypothetical protein